MNRPTSTTRTRARRCRTRPGSTTPPGRGGFTLVELMVVIVVLTLLIALLLPAINGAMRTARQGAVTAEINQLAQALADFKARYGDYPPSRFLAVENGNYTTYLGDTTPLNGGTLTDPYSPGAGDITLGQLAQRSVAALRKFFPRVNTTGGLPSGTWYDFNGNGGTGPDSPYILHGHECLVFFLGGVPLLDSATGTYGVSGFGKDPKNPFTNMIVGNKMYSPNRNESFYQFNPGRLFLDPVSGSSGTNWVGTGIPGYYDTLNGGPPQTGLGSLNFYVYFSAYGNGNYDPNDVNFPETDASNNGPIGLKFLVNFPTSTSKTVASGAVSPAPNPYSSSSTEPTSGTVSYHSAQTFQIISAGVDGLYGVGGQYVQSSQSSASVPLPFDATNTYSGATFAAETDRGLRQRELDNLTNFKSGTLQ